MPFQLVATAGNQTFELPGGVTLVLGRALNSDIPVFDPTISRRHAQLTSDATGVEVRDLGARNGVFLNGVKIEKARVSAGDVVTFGKVAFRLRETKKPSLPTPPSNRAQRGGLTVLKPVPLPAPGAQLSGAGGVLGQTGAGIQSASAAAAAVRGLRGATPEDAPYADLLEVQQKLALLLEVSTALSRAVESDALLEKIVEFTFQILDADLVAVLLTDERGELHPKVAREREGATATRAVPQSIARTAVEQKSGVLSDDAPQDERFGGASVMMQKVRSTMCAPLVGGEGAVLGVLYVDNLTATHRFRESDLEFLIAFAGIAAAALENSRYAERIRREALIRSNFERYFAPSLAARIAASPVAARLGGEKRTVAVLFSDIRGFTPLAERMLPDDIASLLNEHFTELVECVFGHGGTLDKFVGDGVMAQWGAPISSPGDADHALAAALDMMKTIASLNARARIEGRAQLQIGIGISYGEAFAGNIGSERRLEYTVIGDTVNTAARLCAAAGPGEILITEPMRMALSRSSSALVEGAPLKLKGKSKKVRVFRVHATDAATTVALP